MYTLFSSNECDTITRIVIMSGWSIKEGLVGAHACNQHHKHRSMEEVNQCNELARLENKNSTEYV